MTIIEIKRLQSFIANTIRYFLNLKSNHNNLGTKTGKALNYVHDNLMKRSENREDVTDVVLLITDGTSYDDVTIPSEQLRSQNAEV